MIALAATAANGATTAAPAATYWPPSTRGEANAILLTPDGGPRYTVTLSSPAPAELASLDLDVPARTRAGFGAKARRLKVGFARQGPTGDRAIALGALPWQMLSDGGKAARIEVKSPGAKAIRLGIDARITAPGVTLRFAGSGRRQVFGPYPASEIAPGQRYWSPVLEGDTATLEIYLPRGIGPDALALAIPQISHIASARGLLRAEPLDEIGRAASCEHDVVCVATPAISAAAKASAKIFFSKRGNTYLCSATLINDAVSSNTPYLFTASHCIDSQEAASSLQAYWFFDAISCGSLAVPPYATVAGGAMLLARSDDYDWALLRMNNPPPAGATLSAWRAEPIGDGTQVSILHHPEGDLKKLSQASSAGTSPLSSLASGTFNVASHYTLGVTEDGSSGAGLFTLSTGGALELRGALFAGSSACERMRDPDYYSRLDAALPLLAQYLTPNASKPGKEVVVEFYQAELDDYFLTANPAEIDGLDRGVIRGWVRTGLRFLAYSDPSLAPPGVNPVCRFYVLPQYGDSHFYSADPNECAQTAARFSAQWFYETPNAFYIALPDRNTGVCPANTHPVYRFMNRANQLHHRYTAEADLRNCLYYGTPSSVSEPGYCSGAAGDWIQEGYGTPPAAPVMCSPDS